MAIRQGAEDHLIAIFRERDKLARVAVNRTIRRLDRRPYQVLDRVTRRWNPADRTLEISHPSIRRRLELSLEHVTLCGSAGIVTDVQLLGGPWCFDPADVSGPPVSIWQGKCDRIVPQSMGQYFHGAIPGSRLYLDPQAGHVTMLTSHAAEILAQFAHDRP
jgi:pimeloyl-ACP methyl ester carboxylesterase